MLISREIINPELLHILALAGHGDKIVITDRGFPLPRSPLIHTLDLGIVPGLAGLMDVVTPLFKMIAIENIFLAEEARNTNPDFVKDINHFYKNETALHQYDFNYEGFEWIDENDYEANVISFIRRGSRRDKPIVVVCNFSDKIHRDYAIGLPSKGIYEEIFNSQSSEFDGWNITNDAPIKSRAKVHHGRKNMLNVTLPPLGVIYLKKMS